MYFVLGYSKEVVSIDFIRELAGHLDRRTTDRYATLNRLEFSRYLSLLPRIKTGKQYKVKVG